MPIFEYECQGCTEEFELLVRTDTPVRCPACGGEKLDKKFSLFASHAARPANLAPPCHSGSHGCDLGRCGSGSCGAD